MSTKLDLSENISSYKEDIQTAFSNLENELNSISISLNSIPKHQITKINNLLSECENNIKHIEVEVSLIPAKSKEKFNSMLVQYKEKTNKYKKQFNDLRSSRNKTESNEKKNEPNTKLLKISENLDDGSNILGETLRTMTNVSATDKDTNLVLKRQTENIKNATHKLNEADGYIIRSQSVLNNMLKRVFTNKLVLFGLVILLAAINLFLIYIKIKYNILGFKK